MKEFKENYSKEKIKLIDVNGNEHEIEIKFMTSSEFNELEKIVKDEEIGYTEKTFQALIISCGKNKEFWGKFSIELLGEVSKYISMSKMDKKKQING